jgi:hypothetical protein
MRILSQVLTAAVFVACHRAPEEPPAGDAGVLTTTQQASRDSSAPAAAEVGDAGKSPVRDFCTGTFSADSERQRATCSPEDTRRLESVAHIAANLCARDLTAALASTKATFDQQAAEKCVEMLREKALPRTTDTETFFDHFPCDRVLLGTQAEGNPCRFSVECKDGLACVVARGPEGVCAKPPRVGEVCSLQSIGSTLDEDGAEMHHPACDKGSVCDGHSCKPRLGAGKACSGSEACGMGLACVMGKCGSRRPVGGACAKSTDCLFGLWCGRGGAGTATDGGTGKAAECQIKLDDGAECASQDSCKGRCAVDRGKCVSVCNSG